jgi:hypothetical protein
LLYVFVAVVAVNTAEIVSFGYGTSGTQRIVGIKLRKNVVSAYTTITVLEWNTQKQIPLQ